MMNSYLSNFPSIYIYTVIRTLQLHSRLTSVFWSTTFKTSDPHIILRDNMKRKRVSKYDCTINVTKSLLARNSLIGTSNLIGSCWPEPPLFQSWGSLLVLLGLGLSFFSF